MKSPSYSPRSSPSGSAGPAVRRFRWQTLLADLTKGLPFREEAVPGERKRGFPEVLRWWLGTELNRRHEDFQSSALPTELPSQPKGRKECQSLRPLQGRILGHPVRAVARCGGGTARDYAKRPGRFCERLPAPLPPSAGFRSAAPVRAFARGFNTGSAIRSYAVCPTTRTSAKVPAGIRPFT